MFVISKVSVSLSADVQKAGTARQPETPETAIKAETARDKNF